MFPRHFHKMFQFLLAWAYVYEKEFCIGLAELGNVAINGLPHFNWFYIAGGMVKPIFRLVLLIEPVLLFEII